MTRIAYLSSIWLALPGQANQSYAARGQTASRQAFVQHCRLHKCGEVIPGLSTLWLVRGSRGQVTTHTPQPLVIAKRMPCYVSLLCFAHCFLRTLTAVMSLQHSPIVANHSADVTAVCLPWTSVNWAFQAVDSSSDMFQPLQTHYAVQCPGKHLFCAVL